LTCLVVRQPHGHGVFRWFEGDMYMGEWKEGMLQASAHAHVTNDA